MNGPYRSIDDLRALSLDELRALWDLVPAERQRVYRTAYEKTVAEAGAVGSDAGEEAVNRSLVGSYEKKGLVPAAGRWVSVPTRVQEAARRAVPLEPVDEEKRERKPSLRPLLLGGGVMLLFILLLVGRLSRSGEADVQPTPTLDGTPTALALEAQDDIVLGGDPGREAAYPVSLQVTGAGVERVYVVQRRRVDASEWRYDPSPDIASLVYGMTVRPVVGIPWSEENAATFARLGPDAEFVLTLNTGATLGYRFAERREVRRMETGFMRQVAPGLALLLIGERDAEGLPTAMRSLILADYLTEGELSRTSPGTPPQLASPGLLPVEMPTPVPTATPLPFTGLDVQVIAVTTQVDRLTAHLRLYNGGTLPMRFTPDDVWLALGYAESPPGPRLTAEGMSPFDLLPDQAADFMLVWPWAGEPYGSFGVGGWRWSVRL